MIKSLTIMSTTDAVIARDSYYLLPAAPVTHDVSGGDYRGKTKKKTKKRQFNFL
jgi:hypothetical protein